MCITVKKEGILNLSSFRQILIVVIAFLLMLSIKPASAQLMNLHELPEGEIGFGLGYDHNNNRYRLERYDLKSNPESDPIGTFAANLEWAYTEDLKVSFMLNGSWTNHDFSTSPLMGLKVRFMHIGETWSPFFGYFFRSDWGGTQKRFSSVRSIDFLTTTGFGVFFRVESPSSDWAVKLFADISQSIIINNRSDNYLDNPRLEGGFEIQMGQNIVFLLTLASGYENPYTIFHVGTNFYF